MKIAVISDIHSNLDAFETVTANLPSIDGLVCLGDIVGYGPQPNEVVEKLRRMRPMLVILGNHDHAVTTGNTEGFALHAATAIKWTRKQIRHENLLYLSSLRPSSGLVMDGLRTGLYHGSPRDPLNEYIYPGITTSEALNLLEESEVELLLLGHTHIPMLCSLKRGTIANPGSVGQPRDGDPRASFALVTVSSDRLSVDLKRVGYDVESAATKIINSGLPRFLADRLHVGA